ncbi:hypothetical protein QTP70_001497 [Hemibagrus guttatus]|uniref:ribonuclease H n=1 Tax=Hemibagrus guttatus TaxID=175788 RepID=A0AAE0QDM2_9TELE|nr:hypothetical protein QTP70_001497 [Hemibagrus guttatus]
MGRGSPIPPMLRRKIEEQYQKGVSQRKIAKSLKLSSSTVHNIIQRFRESGTISVRKGQGRKTILDARDLWALRRHCITYRNATVMEITTWAQEYFQKTLSVNTIHRAIRRCRLKLYRSKKKPYLNMIQKRRRFLWAKAHLKWTVAKWKTVLWSDESKFEVLFGKLGRHVIRTKEDKDNPSCYQRSVQKPASLMVWSCMSACGMGSLHIWKGTTNAERELRHWPRCELEEEERFWSELDEVMESIPMGERVVIGADFNGHVGEGNTGDEEVMGKFGVKENNLEGQMFRVVSRGRAKKKWDLDRTEENRQEYKELLARQRDRDGKDVQQVRVIKDRDGRVLTSEESVQRRWKEYFEELMYEENEREKRVEGVNSVEQKVDKIRKDEVRKALKRMKSGKAVGPGDIPVEVWKCLEVCQSGTGHVYERSRTVVRCAVGQTEEFKVEVGLHQGSALRPFWFAMVMDQLSEVVRQESPWTMMFADHIVICSESREQAEENLERWRFALERRGMKVSCSKTEYMCVNERKGSGTVRLQGEEVKKVQEFKYLGSTVQSNGECGKEVKKQVQAGCHCITTLGE